MLDSTITDLKLKLYKKELLVSINEIYDDLIEKAGEQSIALIEPRGKGFATAVIAKETLNNEISLTNLINSSPEEVYSKINQLRSQM